MCETYQEQITRLVHALGRGQWQSISDDLQVDSSAERVRLFVDGNSEKRLESLSDQLESVAGAFDDFERLIEVYVRQHPLAAFDTSASDGERMLLWLLDKRALSPVQRDYVLCQRGRHAVEELARCHRTGHVEFQRLRRRQPTGSEYVTDPTTLLHVNPVRANATFITQALLDPRSQPPTEVLFFPDGAEIATVVLEPKALAAVLTLAGMAPCSFEAWNRHLDFDPIMELLPLTQGLIDAGLLAAEAK